MRKGSALLLAILIFAVFLILTALFVKIVYNSNAIANAALVREQAFCLAEAGIEMGKVELARNPNWYTDLPYYVADNVEWLMSHAVGSQTTLEDGLFKIIREKDKNRLYSIGNKGKAIVVLKLTFSNPPFKGLEWKEL
jgi:hypothetical protein